MKIFVVIPAFNEEKRIGGVIRSLKGKNLPIVAVDDGSDDKTYLEVLKLRKSISNLHVLRHRVNLGKGAAMKTGAKAAFHLGADAVIFMDSDGQHTAEDLKGFIDSLNDGYDIIFGSRNLSHGVPLVRYMGNKFASLLVSFLFGIYVSDLLCGYRALTKSAFKNIEWESRGYGVETEMVVNTAKTHLKSCEVPVTTLYYDKFKGVSVLDSFHILFDLIRWRLRK